MEIPKHDLPSEWEEKWRREKERCKKVIEDSEEGLERANQQLKWIVASNDSRTGLRSRFTQRSGVVKSSTSSGDTVEHLSEESFVNQELYCSESYSKDIFQVLNEFWKSSMLTDLTLVANNDKKFQVHSVVLAAVSTFIQDSLKKQSKQSDHSNDHIRTLSLGPEVHHIGLQAVVDFAYTGSICPLTNSSRISCTALQLQFQQALSLCLRFMRENIEVTSCLDVASFAEAYCMFELLEETNDFILRNFLEVSETAKFQDLTAEKLLELIRRDGLCVPTELAVFRAVYSWIETDPKERLGHAGVLMTGVRFPLMTFREFREVRAINMRMECFGNDEVQVELYGSALKEFGFQDKINRVRHPKDVLAVVGGDRLSPDRGHCVASRDVWFANSLHSCTGLMKEMEWKRLGEMPDKPRFRHGVATMTGRLYVVGGCYFYTKDDIMKSIHIVYLFLFPHSSYDPIQNCWKRLADMLQFRSNFSVVAHEARLYAIGGDKEINTNIDSVEMYIPETDSWSYVHPLPEVLSGHGVNVTNAGIFISGGFNSKYECLPSVFLYDPTRGGTYLADMASDRALHCMEALQGRLYVAGGVCNLKKFYTDQQACEVYDPGANAWTMVASLPVPHVGAASAVLEGKIYILGGYSQDGYTETRLIHRFDPCTLRWQNMGTLPGAITDIRACLLRLPQCSSVSHSLKYYIL
uniref:Si:ch211-63p21.8 n=1 Tax=Takifugu rubripes TaxID=31033 RepID=A0A674NM85_TAKRU